MSARAFTLIETLVVAVLIAILAGLLVPAAARALRHAKAWIYGAYVWQNSRIEAFLGENENTQLYYATNPAPPWVILDR